MRRYSPTFIEALQFAAEVHVTQTRKSTTVPYVSHLLAVAGIVMEAGGGETEAIAALLHDSIEDADITHAELERRFGADVARIVHSCSDYVPELDGPEKPEWSIRKKAYVVRLATEPEDAMLVSVADKIHNGESILHDLDTEALAVAAGQMIEKCVWQRFNASPTQIAWYYAAVLEAVEGRLDNPYAVGRLARLVMRLTAESVRAADHRH